MRLVRTLKRWRLEVDMSAPQRFEPMQPSAARRLNDSNDELWSDELPAGEYISEPQVVSMDAVKAQAANLFERLQSYFAKFPKVYSALFEGSYFNTFKSCTHQNVIDLDPFGVAACCSTYGGAAMDALESIVVERVEVL
eukprot:CAMPEP_0115759804 /NCGR_PEP_ID=MMETSP0272-20121206/99661_1 /TAXON_ID=71861 /ORGANISM="Scrippsiella trochoidea, Strain CCMP3099" /LENGTH=138 /DNA_ID=CAMNT_0003205427 /DNA_START=1 /DNA_END=414 /DNA_ORIENTATION=+